ncbi:Hypothetical predicted protein [Paramuricea clavata]|uniref:Uncharacterized protein n=1 Tax=Paramuricea clavata TaxID=317549 RepID=A0A7D9DW56_PARCT|nr:Hypothetical predicted protein [Paramuricea clavata]
MGQSPYEPITDLQISPDGVAKQLSDLNPQKACGPNEIPARVLKEIAQSLSQWLAFIFQQSFDHNAISTDWSQALVTAVFKNNNYKKALDFVPHERVLTKLDYYGIRGNTRTWIKAFITNRSQIVSINGTHSSSKPVISGVP